MPVADMVISLTSPVVLSGLSFLSTRMKELSVMGSEDFSFMLEKVPGAYLNVGNGEEGFSPHHPGYKFDDASARIWDAIGRGEVPLDEYAAGSAGPEAWPVID